MKPHPTDSIAARTSTGRWAVLTRRETLHGLAGALLLATLQPMSRAETLGVNFVGAGSPITDTGGAFGVPLANWNNFTGSGGTTNVSPSSGGAITVTWSTGGGTWQSGATFGGYSAGENQVFSGNLYALQNDATAAGPINITVTGMDSIAVGTYELRLMAAIDGPTGQRRFREAIVNGSTPLFFGAATPSGVSMAATTTNLPLAGDTFNFTIANDNVTEASTRIRAELCGLTLMFTPAPGPVFTLQPQSQTVPAGGNAMLTAVASGTEPLSYQWQFNGVDIAFENNATLWLAGVDASFAGQYRVKVTDGGNRFSFSTSATLVVAPAGSVLAYDPTTVTAASGEGFGGGLANFFDVVAGTSIKVTDLGTALLESTPGSTVTVQLYNAANSAVLATVTIDGSAVSSPVASTPPLYLYLQPLTNALTLGPGSYAVAVYNNSATARVPRAPVGVTVNGGGAIRHLGSRYGNGEGPGTIPNEPDGSGFQYLAGTFKMEVSGTPVITQQPVGGPAIPGGSVSLTVQAGGSQPLIYQWTKENADLAGATNATLLLTNIGSLASGDYRVRVSNGFGAVTSVVATVTVAGAPTVDIKFHAGINVAGTIGLHYQVEYRTELDPPNTWTLLQDIPSLPASPYLVYDPAPATQPKRFYRAMLVP